MSFSKPTRERSGPLLPLSSMVDMLFLLLIVFMTASAMREEERQLDVNLPQTSAAETTPAVGDQTVINVRPGTMEDPQDRVYLGNDDQPITLEELRSTLTKLAQTYPDERILVRGDKLSSVGTLVDVMDVAYAAGLTNVSVGTTKRQSDVQP
jgi:biopolymer transport protein ExbD